MLPGQLAIAKQNWEKVTSDLGCYRQLRTGLQSRVSCSSHPIIFSEASAFARMARGTYEGGDKKFIRKKAIERVRVPQHPQWTSQMFLVQKRMNQ